MGLIQILQSMTLAVRVAAHNSNNSFLKNMIDTLTTSNVPEGSNLYLSIANLRSQAGVAAVGEYKWMGMPIAPTGWLLCDGSDVSRSTYSDLFAYLVPTKGTCTITIANPAVVTLNSHGLQTGDSVYFTTTGALPTGLLANTRYWIIRTGANTFNLATSYANALANTRITTSGSQSGTHTLRHCPYGLGNGSTTFTLPDWKGRGPVGVDTTQSEFAATGQRGGAKTHTITNSELPSNVYSDTPSSSYLNPLASGSRWFGNAGTGAAFSILQPYMTAYCFIKY